MIASLQCRNFRALQDTTWELTSGSHLLLGGTGEGKTSLLEAIYLAATTRSFRTSRLSDCLHRAHGLELAQPPRGVDLSSAEGVIPAPDPHTLFVAVEVSNAARSRLEVSWHRTQGLERRLNSDRSSLEDHLSQQPVLAFSAADIEVLSGTPELRRRLVDRISVALQPSALQTLSRYRKALDHKRALLARQSTSGNRGSRDALRSFNELLAQAAATLVARRTASVQALAKSLRAVNADFPRERFDIELRYASSPSAETKGGALAAEAVLESLDSVLSSELRAHRPLIGPHRDRIEIFFRGRPVAETASAGERKAVALLLLAAQERLLRDAGRPCVLLVDDVDTEMDQATLEAILPLLTRGPQTLFSSNREAVFERLNVGGRWDVSSGAIRSR